MDHPWASCSWALMVCIILDPNFFTTDPYLAACIWHKPLVTSSDSTVIPKVPIWWPCNVWYHGVPLKSLPCILSGIFLYPIIARPIKSFSEVLRFGGRGGGLRHQKLLLLTYLDWMQRVIRFPVAILSSEWYFFVNLTELSIFEPWKIKAV